MTVLDTTSSAAAAAAATARRWPLTGALLLSAATLAAVGAIVLGAAFDWPAVLDEPGTTALPAFSAAESTIRAGFYLELLSSLLLVPAAFGVQQALSRGSQAARVFTTFGVAGALFQLLGWVRWPVAVPGLAERFATGDPAERAGSAAAYDVLNAYAGGAVGEHLGWLLQAPWAVAVGVLALTADRLPRWFGLVGVVAAAAWGLLIVPEPYVPALGGDGVAAVAFAIYTVWFVWLGALGVLLATRRLAAGPHSL